MHYLWCNCTVLCFSLIYLYSTWETGPGRYARKTGMIYMKVHRHLPHSHREMCPQGLVKGCVSVHSHPVCHTTHPSLGVMILQQYYFKFLVHSTPPSFFCNVPSLYTTLVYWCGTMFSMSIPFCLWQCSETASYWCWSRSYPQVSHMLENLKVFYLLFFIHSNASLHVLNSIGKAVKRCGHIITWRTKHLHLQCCGSEMIFFQIWIILLSCFSNRILFRILHKFFPNILGLNFMVPLYSCLASVLGCSLWRDILGFFDKKGNYIFKLSIFIEFSE